jgi:hypothetical protein
MSARRAALALAVLAISALVLVQACTSESVIGVAIGSVRVSPSTSTVLEGLSVQFDAVVYDEEGLALPGAVVVWSSDSDAVASVDAGGLATGVATGETTIRATFNGTEAAARLTVQSGPGIGVAPTSATFYGGASGPTPAPVTLRLTNEGGGSLGTLAVSVSYPAGAPSGWLSAVLASGTAPTDLTLTAGAGSTAIGVGRHRATVTITPASAESGSAPVTVPVTLSLTAFTVTESAAGTRVAEAGATDSLRVVLDVAPTTTVRLLVTSADASEAVVSPATLTFTAASWATPQVVTLAAVNDADVDGDRTTIVRIAVDDGSSDVAYRVALDRTVSVTSVDDDAPGFVVAETGGGTTVTEARASDSLTVVLRSRPTSNVVITTTASDRGEATVAPATLTFRPADWDVPRTVTVTGVDDALVDGSQTSTVTLRVDASRSPTTYQGLPDQIVTVTTLDDDGAGLVVTQSQGSTVVTEAGSTDAITVVLTAQPSADVTVDVTSADIGEATVSPTRLTFTPGDWSTAQPVTVRGVDDALVDGAVLTTVTVSVDAAASAVEYRTVASGTVVVTTLDDDGAALAVVESGGGTAVSESGTSDAFTVALTAQPASNVTLAIASGDTGEAVVSPPTITFTPSDWAQARTVAVTGVDDDLPDGNQMTTITISVDAAASDDAFDGVAARTVMVTTADDDASGFTITSGTTVSVGESEGTALVTVVLNAQPNSLVRLALTGLDPTVATVAPATLTFTPAAWSTPLSVTVTGVADDVDDGDQVATLRVAVDAAASDDGFDAVPAQTVQVTAVDDDTAGFTLADTAVLVVTEAGGTDAFTVVLDARPVTNVVLTVVSQDAGEATVSPATLTFTSANWNVPRTVTLTGVGDASTDGDQVTTVTVAVDAAASDNAFDGVAGETVTVTTLDGDTAGFVLADTSSLTVTEGGGTDAFTVRLTVAPVTNVVLAITSVDVGEVAVAPSTLTFTPANWSVSRPVTLTGIDDAVVDGSQTTVVTVAVVDAASQDAFDGLQATIRVTTTDDDAAGFTLQGTTGLSVTEAGGTNAFTVVLDVAPVSNVVLTVASGDLGEVTLAPGRITFTPTSWSVAQTVTLTGVDDTAIDGDQQTTVTVAVDPAVSDAAFDGLPARNASVTTRDDDAAGLTLADTAGLVVTEAGSTDAFTVVLDAAPVADVVLNVTSGDPSEATVGPATLTFTSANWSTPRTVTVTGVDDALADGSRQTIVTVAVDGPASDPAFAGLNATARVTTADDDAVGVTVSTSTLTVTEAGSSAVFTVRLDAQPTSNVVIDVSSLDQGEVTVAPATLTFTPGDWNVPRDVTATGVDDALVDGNQQTRILIVVDPAQSDSAYDAVPARQVTVTTTDND